MLERTIYSVDINGKGMPPDKKILLLISTKTYVVRRPKNQLKLYAEGNL